MTLLLKCVTVKEGIVIKVTIALSTNCVCVCVFTRIWEGWGPPGQKKEPHPAKGRTIRKVTHITSIEL